MKNSKVLVENLWLNDIQKMVNNMLSDKNKGHCVTAQLPKELIPSGMERGWGDCDKVLIKDLDTMKLFKQEIDKRIDLLKDHIEIMQEEIEYKEDGL